MVIQAIFDFGLWLFGLIAEVLPSTAPAIYDISTTLGGVLSFGVWVIGEDMWLAILGSISGWLLFKLTWGIVLFIYRLIPLT